jgi:hypothetical protein
VWGRIARIPRGVAFLVTFVLVLAGLFLPGAIGGAILLALAVGLALLVRHTWAATPARLRPMRVIVLVLLAAAGLIKIFFGA